MVAADRVYKSGELMPLHDGCNCTTAPVTTRHDPGLDLNSSELDALYKAAGSTGRQDLSNVRVQEYTSQELGPILTTAGVTVPDGQTRPKKALAPRERANKATGAAADRASRPSDRGEQAQKLRARIGLLEEGQANAKRFRGTLSKSEQELSDLQTAQRTRMLKKLNAQLKLLEVPS